MSVLVKGVNRGAEVGFRLIFVAVRHVASYFYVTRVEESKVNFSSSIYTLGFSNTDFDECFCNNVT